MMDLFVCIPKKREERLGRQFDERKSAIQMRSEEVRRVRSGESDKNEESE
jgi:hypothetical protein